MHLLRAAAHPSPDQHHDAPGGDAGPADQGAVAHEGPSHGATRPLLLPGSGSGLSYAEALGDQRDVGQRLATRAQPNPFVALAPKRRTVAPLPSRGRSRDAFRIWRCIIDRGGSPGRATCLALRRLPDRAGPSTSGSNHRASAGGKRRSEERHAARDGHQRARGVAALVGGEHHAPPLRGPSHGAGPALVAGHGGEPLSAAGRPGLSVPLVGRAGCG